MSDPMAFVVISIGIAGAIFGTAALLNKRRIAWLDREIERLQTEADASEQSGIPAE